MGAQSSILESIESLNGTLTSVEHRLFDLEDVFLHHERSNVMDSFVIVSGKRIDCNENVELTVGPILGKIGQLSSLMDERHYTTSRQWLRRGHFEVFNVTGLQPGHNYELYVGGVRRSDVLLYTGNFSTAGSIQSDFLFVENSRFHVAHYGEPDFWGTLAAEGRTTFKSNAPRTILHFGDLANVKSAINLEVMDLLKFATGRDVSESTWNNKIEAFEATILSLFRKSLQNDNHRLVLRYFSSCFVSCGEESVMSLFSSLADPTKPANTEKPTTRSKNLDSSKVCRSIDLSRNSNATAAGEQLDMIVDKAMKDDLAQWTMDSSSVDTIRSNTLLLAARICRSCFWVYFRVLWWDDAPARLAECKIVQSLLKKIIHLQRRMNELNEVSQISSMQAWGKSQLVVISDELANQTERLSQLLANAIIASDDVIIEVDNQLMLLIDSSWKWISSEGVLFFPADGMCGISDLTIQALRKSLNDSSMRFGMCAFSSSPISALLSNLHFDALNRCYGDGSQLKVATSDFEELMVFFSRWQHADECRSAYVIIPNSLDGCQEYVRVQIDDGVERLKLISTDLSEFPFETLVVEESSSIFSNRASYKRSKGFVKLEFSSECSSICSVSPTSCEIKRIRLSSFAQELCVAVVGRICTTKATILLQCGIREQIVVDCVDGLSGARYSMKVNVTSTLWRAVEFSNLLPNRSYDIWCNGLLIAGFTTCQQALESQSSSFSPRLLDSIDPYRITVVGNSIPDHLKEFHTFQMASNIVRCFGTQLSRPWSSIDIIIHGAEAINWTFALNSALEHLSLADTFQFCGDAQSCNREISIARELLSDCIRRSTISTTGFDASRSSHYYISSPVIDLLKSLNYKSIDDLVRDSSQFCADQLQQLFNELHENFHQSLWSQHRNSAVEAKVISEARLLLVELRPSSFNCCLNNDHYVQFERILGDPYYFQDLSWLVVLSPVPIVIDETHNTTIEHGNHLEYSSSDAARIIDFCVAWSRTANAAEIRSKSIILVSTSNFQSFSTNIRIEADQAEVVGPSILQLCVGPINGSEERSACSSRGSLYGNNKYTFEHDYFDDSVGILDLSFEFINGIPTINYQFLSQVVSNANQDLRNNSRIASDKNALKHIILVEDCISLCWNIVLGSIELHSSITNQRLETLKAISTALESLTVVFDSLFSVFNSKNCMNSDLMYSIIDSCADLAQSPFFMNMNMHPPSSALVAIFLNFMQRQGNNTALSFQLLTERNFFNNVFKCLMLSQLDLEYRYSEISSLE